VAVLTRAVVVGNRLYLRVLLADDEESVAEGVPGLPITPTAVPAGI
jgi:hypothetical protein